MPSIEDFYKIGIKLNVEGNSFSKFFEINDVVKKLNRNILNLTRRFEAFNRIFLGTDIYFENFSQSANMAAAKFALLNKEASNFSNTMASSERKSFGHGGRLRHHLGREGAREGFGGFGGGILASSMAPEVLIPLAGAAFLGKESFQSGNEWQQSVLALKASGFSASKGGSTFVKDAIKAALNEKIAGVSSIQYLEATREAAAITRTPSQALLLAPWLAKQTLTNKLMFSAVGRSFTGTDQMNLVRGAELMAHSNDAKAILSKLNIIQQIYGTEQGKVKSYDLFGLSRRDAGGVAELSLKGFFGLVPLIQKIGGSQLGSELRTTQSQLMRGQNFRTGKAALLRLQAAGIFGSDDRAKNLTLLQQDPSAWVNTFLIPQLQKHGIRGSASIQRFMRTNFGGKIPDLLYLLYTNWAQEKESYLTGTHAYNISQSFAGSQKLNAAAVKRLSAAWSNFMVSISNFSSPAIVKGLNAVSDVLNTLTKRINEFTGFYGKFKSEIRGYSHSHPEVGNYLTHGLAGTDFFKSVKNFFHHSGQQQAHVINVHIDGKKVASVASKHISNSANNPPNTSYIFNNSLNQVFPGMSAGNNF